MKVAIASKNKGKIEEFKKLLSDINVEVVDVEFEDVEENGESFLANSLIKAKNLQKYTDLPVIADDSGLCIKHFNGWPGIYTARAFPDQKTYKEKLDKLLEMMEGVEDRSAEFVSCITLLLNNEEYTFIGKTKGRIHTEQVGKNGHGFDPVYICDDLNKTFASLTIEEKNIYSHRAKAFKKLKKFLQDFNKED